MVPLTLSLLAPLAAEASEPLNRLNRWMDLTAEDWANRELAQLTRSTAASPAKPMAWPGAKQP
jgi:hypothetical protein